MTLQTYAGLIIALSAKPPLSSYQVLIESTPGQTGCMVVIAVRDDVQSEFRSVDV